MGDATGIQWTEATWNPVRGCSRVSKGCDHCYAMGQAHRFSGSGQPYEGLTVVRRGKVDWVGNARFHPEMLDQPLRWKKPRRIFVNSMSDLFHESLTNEEIAVVFGVMAAAPQHTFQVLTKRPKRMREWFKWVSKEAGGLEGLVGAKCPPTSSLEGSACIMLAMRKMPSRDLELARSLERAPWPLPNVHLGVSVEDQRTADERIPLLLETPAAVRFISAEPLLSRIDIDHDYCPGCRRFGDFNHSGRCERVKLDWVIVGGESGPGARPCNVEWIRTIVHDCKSSGVPVFVKQLGAMVAGPMNPESERLWGGPVLNLDWRERVKNKKGTDPSEWPEDLRVREFPEVSRG